MTQCAVIGCSNSFRNSRNGQRPIHYHRFPKENTTEYKLWLQFTGRTTKLVTNLRICSDHFACESYTPGTSTSKPKLLKTAVPTISKGQCNMEMQTVAAATDTTTTSHNGGTVDKEYAVRRKPTRKPRKKIRVTSESVVTTTIRNKIKMEISSDDDNCVPTPNLSEFFLRSHRTRCGLLLKYLPIKKRYLILRKLLETSGFSLEPEPEPMDVIDKVEINEHLVINADPACLKFDENRSDLNGISVFLEQNGSSSLSERDNGVEEDNTDYKTRVDINGNDEQISLHN